MPSVLSRLRGDPVSRAFAIPAAAAPYDIMPSTTMKGSPVEASNADFASAVRTIGSRSSTVASAVTQRSLLVSQIVPKFRSVRSDDQRLFGTQALSPLERPGGDVTRSSLLSRIEPDVAYHGNAYIRRLADGRLRRLRPDWVTLLIGSKERPGPDARLAADAEVVGYIYKPGGESSGIDGQFLAPSEVAHWAPEPHPLSTFIGEAWVTAIWRELAADMQATDHVSKYFANAATANMIAIAPPGIVTPEQFNAWVDAFDGAHKGASNAWKTIYTQAGTDIKVIGSQLGDLKMAELQGGFETRVSARSRVPATVLMIREGLGGSALNAGNYQQTRRMWADSWFQPYAQGLCAVLERIIDTPSDAELTFDPSRILLLQEDQKDAADIRQTDAITIRTLVDAGYSPDAAVSYVRSNGDLSTLIGSHSGMYSVQLQEPGAQAAVETSRALALSESIARSASQQSGVTVNLPDVHVDAPQVNVDAEMIGRAIVDMPAPVVNNTIVVEPTPVTIRNDVSPTPVTITNDVQPAAVHVTNEVTTPPAMVNVQVPRTKHRVKRDKSGNITEVIEEPV